MEVYNAWWEMPEDPHTLELDRVREEMAGCDLLIVLDSSGEAGAGATRTGPSSTATGRRTRRCCWRRRSAPLR